MAFCRPASPVIAALVQDGDSEAGLRAFGSVLK